MSHTTPSDRSLPLSPLLIAVLSALLVWLVIASLGSYRNLSAAHERRQLLQSRIEETRARNQELTERIRRLQSDAVALERVAREQYRMMRPDDVILILPAEAESQ